MQWAWWWGTSKISPWTKILKGPVVTSASSHALPRGGSFLVISSPSVSGICKSSYLSQSTSNSLSPSGFKGSRQEKQIVQSDCKGQWTLCGSYQTVPRSGSHRVYVVAIFSETKFLTQVLLLPTCSKCRRPAVARSSYWTKALSSQRDQTREVEQWAGDCWCFGCFSPSQPSPEGVGTLLQPVRNWIGWWHKSEKLRSWQSFPSLPQFLQSINQSINLSISLSPLPF